MIKFATSQPASRLEDARFLTGRGSYIDDIVPEGALFAHVFRSPVAHARITTLELSRARALKGVRLVLSAADLEAAGVDLAMQAVTVKNRDGSRGAAPRRPILAQGRVRFVGEPVALIVADTLALAKDAAELIGFEYQELEPHLERLPGGAEIHAQAPRNIGYDWEVGDAEAVAAAFARAARVVRLSVEDNRIIANSMEPRGCFAEWDGARLHLAVNGQGVWGQKAQLAAALGLAADRVRVTTPDVGGGFGMKAMPYPEYFAVAEAARQLARPVRWMAERTEAMLSDNGGRDLVSTAELAFDAEARILALRVEITSNLGAYNSQFAQLIQSELASKVMTGVYDVQAVYAHAVGVYTNTTPVDAYRGAGRPEAIYTLERCIDLAARELGVDAWELRRRNFIPASAFPYCAATGELYDVGDFARVLDRAELACDHAGFAARKAASKARGRLRGLGLCTYIEAILGAPTETAAIEFNVDGSVSLFVGTQSTGQGHETVYAQILHEASGIPVDAIRIVQGDSDRIPTGGGTGGSRSVTTQGTATLATVTSMVAAFTAFLRDQFGVDEIAFEDGTFRVPGSNRTLNLIEAAALARAAKRPELLRHTRETTLPGRSYPNGAHVCEVEIDPETGAVTVERYTVVDDLGVLINPMLAEGQVHGGVVQGIGQAIGEHVVHDQTGQLLSATFMDYAMPRADTVPWIGFHSEPVPSTANPLGMKGCGEAGTVGALAAVANAVLDALWQSGIREVDMPFTPLRVWSWMRDHAAA